MVKDPWIHSEVASNMLTDLPIIAGNMEVDPRIHYHVATNMVMDQQVCYHIASNMVLDPRIYHHTTSNMIVHLCLLGRPEADSLEGSWGAEPTRAK